MLGPVAGRIWKRQAATLGNRNTARVYKKESTAELLNSLSVLYLCSQSKVVEVFPRLSALAKNARLETLFNSVVKNTFFKRFCGGETETEIIPTMKRFASCNVGSIVALSVEADLNAASASRHEALAAASDLLQSQKNLVRVAASSPGSFIAVKFTAFYPPHLLQEWSLVLEKLRGAAASPVSLSDLRAIFPRVHVPEETTAREKRYTFTQLRSMFSLLRPRAGELLEAGQIDLELVSGINAELRSLCEFSRAKGVKIIMDAEQTYFQPAIDDLIIGLCKEFNAPLEPPVNPTQPAWTGPMIFNTYQCYLTSTLERLKLDMQQAMDEGYSLGIKAVRGAYLVQERELASQQGVASPVFATLRETHASYNAAVEWIIVQQSLHSHRPVSPFAL
ncbi:hypothetical protein HDU91_002858, partial [Kappamyces sp. JEL0680]